MRVKVGDTTLFFEVTGTKLAPDGPTMKEKPTLLCLHGGPGFDHTSMVPTYSAYSDIAQVIFLDHRGNGRSDRSTSDHWNLEQWADDVYEFCQVMEIEKPIVLGSSFGGIVTQKYGVRHPDHPAKLILTNTMGRIRWEKCLPVIEKLGGARAREVADAWWLHPSPETWEDFIQDCMPLYTTGDFNRELYDRCTRNYELSVFWNGPEGQGNTFNLLPELHNIKCPVLFIAGTDDPVCPIEETMDLAGALPKDLLQFELLKNASHGVVGDGKDHIRTILREFISS